MNRLLSTALLLACPLVVSPLAAQQTTDHRVLATSKTSTMQSEMQQAGADGYRFAAVMGGDTAVGGSEVVVVMQKPAFGSADAATAGAPAKFEYRLLATSKTSTMQKELQEAANVGFQYVGQTVFETAFGGDEVVCILERETAAAATAASGGSPRYEYKLLATSRTSTLEKELKQAGAGGYSIVGMTVGKTMAGGEELVAITRRRTQ